MSDPIAPLLHTQAFGAVTPEAIEQALDNLEKDAQGRLPPGTVFELRSVTLDDGAGHRVECIATADMQDLALHARRIGSSAPEEGLPEGSELYARLRTPNAPVDAAHVEPVKIVDVGAKSTVTPAA